MTTRLGLLRGAELVRLEDNVEDNKKIRCEYCSSCWVDNEKMPCHMKYDCVLADICRT